MLNLRFAERCQIVKTDLASDLATAIPLAGCQALKNGRWPLTSANGHAHLQDQSSLFDNVGLKRKPCLSSVCSSKLDLMMKLNTFF